MKCRATTKRQEPCGKAALDKPQLGEIFSETAFVFPTTCILTRNLQQGFKKFVNTQVPYNKNAPLEIFLNHCEVFSPVKRGKQTSSSMPNESGNLLTTESAR